jgi:hypothetical protein
MRRETARHVTPKNISTFQETSLAVILYSQPVALTLDNIIPLAASPSLCVA